MKQPEPQDINAYLASQWDKQGVEYYKLGQIEKAIASYDQALHFKPDNHQAWNNRGVALYNLGQFEQAIASYDQAIQIKPDYHGAWKNRGIALRDLGIYIDEDIREYGTWHNQSVALEKLGQFEEAISSFDKALRFKPDDHETWHNRGYALEKLGQFEQAISSYDKALHIKPDDYQVWHNRGVALVDLGKFEEAISSYDKAIQIKPDLHNTWHNRGYVLEKLGKFEQAISSCDKALHFKPDNHEAWYNRGVVLWNLGRIEEAISSYDQAIQIKPDLHEAWNNRGCALRHLGQFEEAISSCTQALNIKPDYHEAWYNRGCALRHLGQFEEAISSYDKALNIKPDYHEAWIGRGIAAGNSLNYNPQTAVMLQLQFPASTPIFLNSTLTRRGYEGKLLCFQEGLKHCLQDTHPEGWGLLHLETGKAHYFQGKGKRNYRDYWHQAVGEYHQALITLTPEAFPELHLEVVRDLMRVLFGLGKDTEAKQWRRKGLDVFRQLFNSKTTSFQKRQLEAKFSGFSQMRVDVLVEDGDLVTALETAERNKNLYLTWILDAQNEHILSPSYADIQQLLNPTTAIIYWHLSPHALTTFIIKHGAAEPIVITESLPNPPLRDYGARFQSPPELGDLGGEKDLGLQETKFQSPPELGDLGGEKDLDTDSSLRQEEAIILPPSASGGLRGVQEFETWVNNWNKQYQDYRSRKEKALPPNPPW
jgi:tetratricopeptide (TPR) repeat protein